MTGIFFWGRRERRVFIWGFFGVRKMEFFRRNFLGEPFLVGVERWREEREEFYYLEKPKRREDIFVLKHRLLFLAHNTHAPGEQRSVFFWKEPNFFGTPGQIFWKRKTSDPRTEKIFLGYLESRHAELNSEGSGLTEEHTEFCEAGWETGSPPLRPNWTEFLEDDTLGPSRPDFFWGRADLRSELNEEFILTGNGGTREIKQGDTRCFVEPKLIFLKTRTDFFWGALFF